MRDTESLIRVILRNCNYSGWLVQGSRLKTLIVNPRSEINKMMDDFRSTIIRPDQIHLYLLSGCLRF